MLGDLNAGLKDPPGLPASVGAAAAREAKGGRRRGCGSEGTGGEIGEIECLSES